MKYCYLVRRKVTHEVMSICLRYSFARKTADSLTDFSVPCYVEKRLLIED